MANLSAPLDLQERDGKYIVLGVAASTPIFKGGLLELSTTGYAQPWNPSDGYPFLGVATGGSIVPISPLPTTLVGTTDGWTTIKIQRKGLIRFPYAAAAVTNVGKLVYASDDNTITLSATGDAIGIVAVTESGYLWVDITGFTEPPQVITWPLDASSATGTGTTGIVMRAGTSGAPVALNTANQKGIQEYYSTTATTGTTYGRYVMLTSVGVGVEAISSRSKTYLTTAAAANAHGLHATLELAATGSVSGLGTGLRGNLVITTQAVAAGTYYGVMAEIYPNDNTAALPAGSNACLGINAQTGTAMDLVVNAIAFNGADGSGKMIYTAGEAAPAVVGSIRILVNGAIKYLYYGATQA